MKLAGWDSYGHYYEEIINDPKGMFKNVFFCSSTNTHYVTTFEVE